MSSISISSSFYFNEHRFRHNLENCINAVCTCPLEDESTKHFFLTLPLLSSTPYFFLKWLKQHVTSTTSWESFVKTLLYENPIFDESDNHKILETSIRYILEPKRFSGNLL